MSYRVKSGYLLLSAGLFQLVTGASVTAQERSYAVYPSDRVVAQVAGTLESRISLDVQNRPLREVINEIASLANLRVVLGDDAGQSNRRVTVKRSNAPVRDVLGDALSGSGLIYRMTASGHLMISAERKVTEGTIIGKVIDAKTKKPIRGAAVSLNDESRGVETDANGAFRIVVPTGQHRVTVRGLGYTRNVQSVTVVSDGTITVEILLEPTASVLGEVVVTGTVVATERKAIPTPITVIKAEDIERRGITRVDQLLRGEVPGVLALDQGVMQFMPGSPEEPGRMAVSSVYSRGSASLDGGANPMKTYIDGVELVDASYLGTIDPATIERIEIITGPQAATIYGAGAMGGVMQIFTKSGGASQAPEITATLKYGILENNLSSGKTPVHNDVLSITGGNGPQFTYSGNLSYQYQGQWQPKVYNRRFGGSLGARYLAGPVTVGGSASVTRGTNGTFHNIFPGAIALAREGVTNWDQSYGLLSAKTSRAFSQSSSLNVDYRPSSQWQHHITLGRSQNVFSLVPASATYGTVADTVMRITRSDGARTTAGYNSTALLSLGRVLTTTTTVGATASWAEGFRTEGTVVIPSAPSFQSPRVTRTLSADNWGVFGSLQSGFFERLYVTLGVRGEHSKAFGRNRRMDWTPTNGVTYTLESGQLSVKFLASYGRSTKVPDESMQLSKEYAMAGYLPELFTYQLAAPNLRPEYSLGPQGGIEIYYGNLGSLTINRYRQNVTDLIQLIPVDTLELTNISTGDIYKQTITRYENIAKIRQHGWEGTASVNLGPLAMKGTYSWNDSRIVDVSPLVRNLYQPGEMFHGVPTHFGSIIASYGHGVTSVTLTTSYVGASIGNTLRVWTQGLAMRDRQYWFRRASIPNADNAASGYYKSDLAVTHRLNPWASVTANIVNLGNSFGTEERNFYVPTLGRTSTFGVMLRMPNRR